jgi:hypothetical protein
MHLWCRLVVVFNVKTSAETESNFVYWEQIWHNGRTDGWMDTFSQEDFHIFASSNNHLRHGTVKRKFSGYLSRNSWPRCVCNRTSRNLNKMLVRMTFVMVLLWTVSSQIQENVLQHLSKVMEHGQHVTGLSARCDVKRCIVQITLQTRLYGALSNKP